jgi:hypothetical protein
MQSLLHTFPTVATSLVHQYCSLAVEDFRGFSLADLHTRINKSDQINFSREVSEGVCLMHLHQNVSNLIQSIYILVRKLGKNGIEKVFFA